jgi:hypothetical protein
MQKKTKTQLLSIPYAIEIPNCAWDYKSGFIIDLQLPPQIIGFHFQQLGSPEPEHELSILNAYLQKTIKFYIHKNILIRNPYFFIQIQYLPPTIQKFIQQHSQNKTVIIPPELLLKEIKYIDYINMLDILI